MRHPEIIYCFSSSEQLTGTLTLNGQGNPNAFFLDSDRLHFDYCQWIFCSHHQRRERGLHILRCWKFGDLGTTTAFNGNILALTSITLNTGASIQCGRALASNGAVTLDSNAISIDTAGCEASSPGKVPEPSTVMRLGFGLVFVGVITSVT
jgi:hypothetical protein